jgi:predicted secreted protein
MTLLVTVFSAIIATLIWYCNEKARVLKIGVLCYMYWGASIMWFVDAIFEYVELKAEYFKPTMDDMVNDLFLGLSVVALAMIIWIIIMLIKDPYGVIKKTLSNTRYK